MEKFTVLPHTLWLGASEAAPALIEGMGGPKYAGAPKGVGHCGC